MAVVYFFKYYCQCGNYLFDNADITYTSAFGDRNYIFIDKKTDICVYAFNNSVAKCGSCHKSLGGIVYQEWRNENLPDLIRFACHLLHRQKVYLSISRVVDEDEVLRENFYHVNLLYGQRRRLN